VTPTVTAAVSAAAAASENVDWSQVHAVRLLGVALAFLFLLWAIRRMFGGKK
jgi:flagellar biogenesis protein FliO